MILSIDAEKAFDKIQHLFLIKTIKKEGIEGSYGSFLSLIDVMNHVHCFADIEPALHPR